MKNHSILFGILLSLLGIILYVATGMEHKTSLIPTGFGVVLIVMGLLAAKEALRMHVMHVAALVGLLGLLGGFGMGIPKLIKEGASPAVIGQLIMGVLCLAFVVLCIKSFKDARKAKAVEATT